ncbi:MAG: WXG100 family type VII secretion target [Actinomycetales bacterium]|nr:WXG100 family type VII secretion target [Actinomycetales bacterium]
MAVFDHGMDVAAVTAAAGRLQTIQQKLDSVISTVDSEVALLGKNWAGTDQMTFAKRWRGHQPNLKTIGTGLGRMASKCINEAKDQERSSS